MTFKEHLALFSSCIVLLIWLTTGCSSDQFSAPEVTQEAVSVVNQSDLTLLPEKGIVTLNNSPFSGKSLQYYPNGNVSIETNYKAGKKNGVYKKWFPDGALSFESYYRNGKIHGTTKSWWKSGNLRTESNFIEGVPHGEQRQWYKTGEKFKLINLVNGREEGMQRAWRQNGKIYNNYEAKNGRIFGLKKANLCFSLDEEVVQYGNN